MQKCLNLGDGTGNTPETAMITIDNPTEHRYYTDITSKGIFFRNYDNSSWRASLAVGSNNESMLILNNNPHLSMLNGYLGINNGTIRLDNGLLVVGNILASGYGNFEGNVSAKEFTNSSQKELKENIYRLKGNSKKKTITRKASDIVKNTDICEYNFKGNEHKQIGVIIGNGYNTPNEILSEDKKGVDLYSMISVLYKAFQEQNEEMQNLKERLDKYEK